MAYAEIYSALAELRESFHRSGRLDDSNAKLDEVAKLFATYLAFRRGQIDSFAGAAGSSVKSLRSAFETAARLPQYLDSEGRSVFGPNPSLALRDEDNELARDLVKLVANCVDFAFDSQRSGSPFDVLNEAFGHFVRDNFRGNVEDAQYMTPPEVVDFMTDLVLQDLKAEDSAANDPGKHWTVVDPTCGVASFLASVYQRARTSSWLDPRRLRLFGQDKVERMVRLATINLELFESETHRVTRGNSLAVGSPLDELEGRADIVLTNPPFGARFDQKFLRSQCGRSVPFASELRASQASVDSELLFVDRGLQLLRPGGRLLIVVPDGVVSARGAAAQLRNYLAGVATVRAVVELPAVTFAQAGTRTKTAMLYLEKGRQSRGSVFMASATDLGFQVSSRKGVQIKVPDGKDELPSLLRAYSARATMLERSGPEILSERPSAVAVPESEIRRGSWTPNHYHASRYNAIRSASSREIQLKPLGSLVTFCSDARRAQRAESGGNFISVLHVLGESLLDLASCAGYVPKTPGVPVNAGEVLISRINPRIPRVCVVPDMNGTILCSSEFEVMQPSADVDPYELMYVLLSKPVQSQIASLTSGTSASHNRIRTSELAEVLIPVPIPGSPLSLRMKATTKRYRASSEAVLRSLAELSELREQEASLLSN